MASREDLRTVVRTLVVDAPTAGEVGPTLERAYDQVGFDKTVRKQVDFELYQKGIVGGQSYAGGMASILSGVPNVIALSVNMVAAQRFLDQTEDRSNRDQQVVVEGDVVNHQGNVNFGGNNTIHQHFGGEAAQAFDELARALNEIRSTLDAERAGGADKDLQILEVATTHPDKDRRTQHIALTTESLKAIQALAPYVDKFLSALPL